MELITMRIIYGHNFYAALSVRSLGGFIYQTQGVAVGLEYVGLSARNA